VTLRFADLNPLGRAIILVVAALTLAVAGIAFATSYGALYAWARDTGLYSDRLTRIWPLLLDGAFIVAQLAAILAGILRGNRAFPILTMLLTGALTVWFNLQHAGNDPGRRLTAALPPILMMLAFEIDVQIVRWVMHALGKPIGPITPPPPDGMLASPVPGAVWRSDALGWNVPPYGSPPDAYGQVPAAHHLPENRQNRQAGLPIGNGAAPAGPTKRQRIEEYLDWLGPEELQHVTVRELTADLQENGLEVNERYVSRSSTPNDRHHSHVRPSGGGGAAPASPADDRSQAEQAGHPDTATAGARTRPGAPEQPGSRRGRPRRRPDGRAVAGRGRRPGRGGRLLPARPPSHLAGHAAPGRPR
jgi:hypothetical protein